MPPDLGTEEFLLIFGANVERERLRCKLTQEEVAEQLGISVRTYQRYEQGAVNVPLGRLRRLKQIFKCEDADLMRVPEDEK